MALIDKLKQPRLSIYLEKAEVRGVVSRITSIPKGEKREHSSALAKNLLISYAPN